eukprot:GFKZ01012049.1.p1 GENE.GFKZ01012049.1~~GFKZ01012049.1.p1  ORF type:complete len:170 (+),score=3.28 GFKZ01012049.1:221-730(+)
MISQPLNSPRGPKIQTISYIEPGANRQLHLPGNKISSQGFRIPRSTPSLRFGTCFAATPFLKDAPAVASLTAHPSSLTPTPNDVQSVMLQCHFGVLEFDDSALLRSVPHPYGPSWGPRCRPVSQGYRMENRHDAIVDVRGAELPQQQALELNTYLSTSVLDCKRVQRTT